MGVACAFGSTLLLVLLVLSYSTEPTTYSATSRAHGPREGAPRDVVELTMVVVTFFASAREPRFQLTVRTLEEAARAHIPVIVVDASQDSIRAQLGKTGAHVVRQSRPGRKGAALREGLELALRTRSTERHVIAFFEPEKQQMVRWIRLAAEHLRSHALDIVIPGREPERFARTYPREQYHQEMFTNLMLDAYAASSGAFPPGLDWTFGPVLFDARLAPVWLAHEGALWDAQVVPFVRAVRWHGARIGGFPVPYAHASTMKHEEEGKLRWARKRFDQLALWARVLPGEFNAIADPDGGRVQLRAAYER